MSQRFPIHRPAQCYINPEIAYEQSHSRRHLLLHGFLNHDFQSRLAVRYRVGSRVSNDPLQCQH